MLFHKLLRRRALISQPRSATHLLSISYQQIHFSFRFFFKKYFFAFRKTQTCAKMASKAHFIRSAAVDLASTQWDKVAMRAHNVMQEDGSVVRVDPSHPVMPNVEFQAAAPIQSTINHQLHSTNACCSTNGTRSFQF